MFIDSSLADRTEPFEPLRWVQAFTANLAHRMASPRLDPFEHVEADGVWHGEATARLVAALNAQTLGRDSTTITEGLYAWFRQVSGHATVEELLAFRNPPPPPPPEPVVPDPDPAPVEPRPAGAPWARMVVINDSQALDSTVRRWVDAWAWQIEAEAADHYGYMSVEFGSLGSVTRDDWVHVVADKSDIQGAGGYHTVEGLDWEPTAYTFLSSGQPSVVGSHECLEVLGNAFVSQWVLLGNRKLWWRELCDPVQRIVYAAPNGIDVSDFVLNGWWGDYEEGSEEYHAAALYHGIRVLTSPTQLAPGGYMGQLDPATWRLDYVWASQNGTAPVPAAEANVAPSVSPKAMRLGSSLVGVEPLFGEGCLARHDKLLRRIKATA